MLKFNRKTMFNEQSIFSHEMNYFMLVFDQGSITGAARQLGQDPGNISRMIAKLERCLGANLFVRHKTGLQATGAGRDLYNSISKARGEFFKTFQKAANSARSIRIGFSPTIGHTHFSSKMTEGLTELRLEPDFLIASSQDLIERMKLRQLDFALVHSNIRFPGLVSKKIAHESLVLCSSSGEIQATLLLHPDMLGLEKVVHSVPYNQRWLIKDYFVLAKMLTLNQQCMGVLPESLLKNYPLLKYVSVYKDFGKITALSWPSSIGVEFMRWLEK